MRKIFYAILASLTLLTSASASGPDKQLHKKCLYPVLLVTPHNRAACGSGVIVRSVKVSDGVWHNVFVTCAHVAEAHSEHYIVKIFHYENWSSLKDSTSYKCKFYAIDLKKDLAIGVFVSNEELPTAEIDFATSMYIGTDVFRIGCGMGDEPRLDYGKITAVLAQLSILKSTLRTSIHTLPGDSGSPLFHDYKIVGIMQAIRVYQGLPVFATSYAIPVERLKTWDDETKGALNFVWRNKCMPQMPFYQLNLEQYEVDKDK